MIARPFRLSPAALLSNRTAQTVGGAIGDQSRLPAPMPICPTCGAAGTELCTYGANPERKTIDRWSAHPRRFDRWFPVTAEHLTTAVPDQGVPVPGLRTAANLGWGSGAVSALMAASVDLEQNGVNGDGKVTRADRRHADRLRGLAERYATAV